MIAQATRGTVAGVAVTTRAWAAERAEAVSEAMGLAEHWTHDAGRAVWKPWGDGERWSRAVVVEVDDQPVAVAGAFHPRLHPTRDWVYVEVARERRRQGWGSRALAELTAVLPKGARPFRARVAAGSPGERFARRHWMERIQRCRLVRVDVAVEPATMDVRVHPQPDEGTVEAWRDYYVAGHNWDPPGEQSLDVWSELTPRTGPAITVWQSGLPVGIGLVVDDRIGRHFVGGAINRADPQGVDIARQLLFTAAGLTGSHLVVELDDWMTETIAAVGPMPHRVIDTAFSVGQPLPAHGAP